MHLTYCPPMLNVMIRLFILQHQFSKAKIYLTCMHSPDVFKEFYCYCYTVGCLEKSPDNVAIGDSDRLITMSVGIHLVLCDTHQGIITKSILLGIMI